MAVVIVAVVIVELFVDVVLKVCDGLILVYPEMADAAMDAVGNEREPVNVVAAEEMRIVLVEFETPNKTPAFD